MKTMKEQEKGNGEDRLETGMNGKSFRGRPGPTCGCQAKFDDDNNDDDNYIVNFK
jgi:hypothetical protein